MRLGTTLFLLAATTVLAAVWFFADRSDDEQAAVSLPVLDAADVYRISIRRGETAIVLERDGETWRMTEPASAPANAERLRAIAERFAAFDPAETVIAGASPDQYGLTTPRLTLTLATPEASRSIDIGRAVPLSDNVAARVSGGDGVFSMPAADVARIDVAPISLLERRLFPLDIDALEALLIRTQEGAFMLTRRDGQWRVESGMADYRATRDRVDALLETLETATAAGIELDAPPLSELGLERGQVAVRAFYKGEDRTLELILGDSVPPRPGYIYARRSGVDAVWTVSNDVLLTANRPASYYRDRALVEGSAFELDAIDLRQDDRRLLLQRRGNAWIVGSEAGELPADFESAERLAGRITAAQIDTFIDDADFAAFGFDRPEQIAALAWRVAEDEDGGEARPPLVLTFGRRLAGDEGKVYVRHSVDDKVYAVDAALLDALQPSPLRYRSRALLTLDDDTIERVDIAHDGRHTVLARREGAWRFVEPDLPPERIDAWRLDDLLRTLRRLRAAEFVAESAEAEPGRYGLDDPWAVIRFDVEEGGGEARGMTLRIGRLAGGGPARYGALDGDSPVFTLDAQTVRVLSGGVARP